MSSKTLLTSFRFRKFWDYRTFFTKVVRYRFMVLILYSVFQQWNGGGIIGTFLVPALETVGIDDAPRQLGINIGDSDSSTATVSWTLS